jgi:hypothetical protein
MGVRLQNTFGTPTNNKIFTLSFWIKKNNIGATHTVFCGGSSSRPTPQLVLDGTGKFAFSSYNGSGYDVELRSNMLFRDPNGWYHVVMAVDTTQATSSNRVKAYVNGEQITSWGTESYPSQNFVLEMNNAHTHVIGGSTYNGPTGSMSECILSHYNFIDGIAYTPSAFGSTDTTTGEWKINTSPNVTYGNNGFLIFKDGMTITDSSPNSNDWSVGTGTLTKTEDNPSNVFATLNALAKPGAGNLPSFGNGNTHYNKTATGAGNNSQVNGTIGASSGKYYFELKQASNTPLVVGVSTVDAVYDSNGASLSVSGTGVGVGYYSNGQKYINGTASSYGNTWTTNDIIGVAFDLDNNYVYFSKNGTWENSGNPTSGGSGTGGLALTANVTYTPAVQNNGYNDTSSAYFNFGNGYFGTTAVSSAGTNASNNGIFEYDVPTGYTALSTKGLNL